MANDDHIAQLKKGVAAWNAWMKENHDPNASRYLIQPDLSWADLGGADLTEANLEGANLFEANLERADLRGANLRYAELGGAKLSGAKLSGFKTVLIGAHLRVADLSWADLGGADLTEANLEGANLEGANLEGAELGAANLNWAKLGGANLSRADLGWAKLGEANLNEANLRGARLHAAQLVGTDLRGADLTGCRIHGVSAWNLKLERAKQQSLVITDEGEPEITVDHIEVAQFIYLMLNNQKVRDVIDTITSKVVLILGRFTDERKAVLDALREELRRRNYLPILFDFEVPARRNITETVTLLARMARFIIADLTDPSSIPQELQAIIPSVRVPVQPLLLEGSSLYSMFKDFDPQDFHWVLPEYRYENPQQLLATLAEKVIAPAEGKVKALEERRHKVEAELTKPQ
jgi:uncharacterized protein YjbI with pentapeptide repeats